METVEVLLLYVKINKSIKYLMERIMEHAKDRKMREEREQRRGRCKRAREWEREISE